MLVGCDIRDPIRRIFNDVKCRLELRLLLLLLDDFTHILQDKPAFLSLLVFLRHESVQHQVSLLVQNFVVKVQGILLKVKILADLKELSELVVVVSLLRSLDHG